MNDTTKKIIIIILFFIVIIVGIGFWIFNEGKSEPEPVLQTGIVVASPKANEEVSSPLKITGYVNGDGWSGFEGQVGSVKLLDNDGNEITQSILSATSDWMTPIVNFEANLYFEVLGSQKGVLVFKNENPSGLPDHDKQFSLPVDINKSTSEIMYLGAYFNKKDKDKIFNLECNDVGYVGGMLPRAEDITRAVLEYLLKGPDKFAKESGWYSSIPVGVKIQSLNIGDNGVVRVDFSKELEVPGGSCRVSAIRAQITQTLKQFPSVKNVIISINGRTEDILQP